MKIEDLDTPALVIDLTIAQANLRRAQAFADETGLKLRPHIKTHKLPFFAKMQVEYGAVGIACQKLGEAEVMADAGLADIFLPYNILGCEKLERLSALHGRVAMSVTADSDVTVAGYAARFSDAGHPLPVLVECDTGGGRVGVQSPADALALAQRIDAAPGLLFEGLMTYPPRGRPADVEAWMAETVALLSKSGLKAARVSNGGSPDYYRSAVVRSATEHRPGTYIYNDRMQVGFGHATPADCALTVLATVVSRPTADRAVLDCGSKALAADRCDAGGHGWLPAYPEAVVTSLSEEHGVVDLSACPQESTGRPAIGEKVRVVPNHACVVTNLFDVAHIAVDGAVVERLPIAARGRMG